MICFDGDECIQPKIYPNCGNCPLYNAESVYSTNHEATAIVGIDE